METTEEDAENCKFISDRCKLSIGNKIIIDNCLLDCALTSFVKSLQISGFTIYFISTSLEEPGFYVTKGFYGHTIFES